MAKYAKAQHLVMAEYNKMPDSSLFIKKIILDRPSHLPLKIQLPNINTSDTKSVAQSFEQSCYDLMTNDVNRTDSYRKWINDILLENNSDVWLEIGPGSNATLSLILLKQCPSAKYIGVEINKTAYLSAKKILKNYPNVQILNEFIDENFSLQRFKNVDYIFHEIFGIIASSEGVVQVMNTLMSQYPQAISIPSFAETYITLLDMSPEMILADPTLVINHKYFKCKIPFGTEIELSSTHAILERLDFSSIILNQTHKTTYQIKRDGTLTVLGIYILLSMNNFSTSSNSSLQNASTSWANLGIVLPKAIPVKLNQKIHIICKSYYDELKPMYEIFLEVGKNKLNWIINYDDIYGFYQDLHTIRE